MSNTHQQLTHCVSFSGGRTSAYLVYLMEITRKNYGWNVKYIFCDTGVEHPQTYVFIRNIVKFWNIDLIILRADVNPTLGKGNSYTEFSINDLMNTTIMPPFEPFLSMMKKYGTPTAFSPYCSERMKKDVTNLYCKEHFGKNYLTWLGMRSDEPKRIKEKLGIKYLADLKFVEKQDILDWWKHQPFDLQLEEQEGNCLFCIKKSTLKIALAIKQNPHFFNLWKYYLNNKSIRIKGSYDKFVMYRGKLSLDGIAKMHSDIDERDIRLRMRSSKRYETGSCTESCEAFNLDGIEVNWQVVEKQIYNTFEDQLKQIQFDFT